jgi:hypothetical protein
MKARTISGCLAIILLLAATLGLAASPARGEMAPQINAKGQVVWEGSDGWDGSRNIYLWDSKHPEPRVLGYGTMVKNALPQINGKGQIVWTFYDNAHWGICVYNSKKPDNPPIAPGSYPYNDNSNPIINDKGYVVWEATGPGPGIYLYSPKIGEQGLKIYP